MNISDKVVAQNIGPQSGLEGEIGTIVGDLEERHVHALINGEDLCFGNHECYVVQWPDGRELMMPPQFIRQATAAEVASYLPANRRLQ